MPPMINLDAAQDAAVGTCREDWKGSWSGARAGLKEWVERLEVGLDGVPVNWKRALCWSGSWKGQRKIAERELEGEERSEKKLEGGDSLSGWGPSSGTGAGRGGRVFHEIARDWKGSGGGICEICRKNVGRGLEENVPFQTPIQLFPCSAVSGRFLIKQDV